MERNKRKWDALMLAWSAWMADRHPRPLRPLSRYNYISRVRVMSGIAEKNGMSILAADKRTVRYCLGKLSPHPSTQNGYMSALDCLYRFLVDQGLRKDNPILEMGRPPQQRKLPRPLQWIDTVNYLNAAKRLTPVHEGIAAFGLGMGLRRAEIRMLQWVDFFEADKRTWLDIEGKGGKRARLSVPEFITVTVMPDLRAWHDDPRWLFPSPCEGFDGPISETLIRNRHLDILKEAGIEGRVTLHALRHTFATNLHRAGVRDALVQDALRHSDPKSTRIYMQVLPEEVAGAIDKLNDMMNPHKPAPDIAPEPPADEDPSPEVPGQQDLFGGGVA